MPTPRILISGAGIAGSALGVALGRRGISPTVLERTPRPRPGGHTVDLRGHSQRVLRDWGLLDQVLALRAPEEHMVAVGRGGRELWSMPAARGGIVADVEVGREDLNTVLAEASAAEVHYGEHPVDADPSATGVCVRTSGGREIEADLLVIAEGARSSLRALLFPDAESRYLGGHLAFAALPYPRDLGGDMRMYSAPGGVMVAIRPGRVTGHAIIAIRVPRGPELAGDTAAQRRFVIEHATRAGIAGDWHVPSVLDAVAHDPGFHCDELLKITAPAWQTGRAALLGDAAWSGSPLTGRGTAMAIMGAEALAEAISAHPNDIGVALNAYEARMRRFLSWGQSAGTPRTLRSWTPSTAVEIRLAALAMRAIAGTPLRGLLNLADNPPRW